MFATLGFGGAVALSAGLSGVGASALRALNGGREGDFMAANGRVQLWQACLKFAAERPWLGYGFEGFWSEARIEMISADQGWVIQQSHSAYIDQVLALGACGAVLYITLVFGCLVTCLARFWRGRVEYGPWAAALIVILVDNATESIDVSPLFPQFAFILITLHLAFVREPGRPPMYASLNPPFPEAVGKRRALSPMIKACTVFGTISSSEARHEQIGNIVPE
jgi:O-antigen ligase